jgi:hypothetical protein
MMASILQPASVDGAGGGRARSGTLTMGAKIVFSPRVEEEEFEDEEEEEEGDGDATCGRGNFEISENLSKDCVASKISFSNIQQKSSKEITFDVVSDAVAPFFFMELNNNGVEYPANGDITGIFGANAGWFSDNKKDIREQGAKYDFIVDECRRYNPGLELSLHRNGHSGYSGGSIPSQKTKTSARHLVNGKSYVVWKGPRGGLYYKTHDRFVRIK